MATETIREIEEQISRIDAWLRKVKTGDSTWGDEEEYSSKTLKASTRELVRDLRALVKVPSRFIQLYAFEERQNLAGLLEEFASHVEGHEIPEAVSILEQIKPMLRGAHIRRTRESKQDLQQQVDEVHRSVSLLQDGLDEIKIYKSKATSGAEKIAELAQQADASREQLQEQQTAMQDVQGQLHDQLRNVEELTAKIQSNDEIIAHFIAKIEERQQQLQKQQADTSSYEEKLKAFEEWMDQSRAKVDDLNLEAKQALQYRTAAGISAAFIARYDEYKEQRSWLWLVGAGGFLVTLVAFLFFFFWQDTTQSLEPVPLIYRFAIGSAIFSGVYFCAAQYKKHKNVQEDYGFKSVLAKSIVGFLEKLPEGARDEYLARVLHEIHKDPMRKIREVDDTVPERARRTFFRGKKAKQDTSTKGGETPTAD